MNQAVALRTSKLAPTRAALRLRPVRTFERADTEAVQAVPCSGIERVQSERDSGVRELVRLGPYRLLELIGSGAMGNVYKAEHVLLGRRVAIKTMRREFAEDNRFAERMFAEARASDLIGDEHIVQVLDLAREPDGVTWFAMELLEGVGLADLCDRGPLPLPRALDLARQVCEALIRVHDAGIVHRDIKPENIFVVDRDGTDFVKLLDFGIARLPDAPVRSAAHEIVIGTPPYMAPEQVYGGPVDHRSDLYAVGALLFELLTGCVLWERESMTELLGAIVLAQPPLPSEHVALPAGVREPIDRLVRACLCKDPAGRPASARELAAELAAITALLDAPEVSVELPPEPEPSIEIDLRALDDTEITALPDGSESARSRSATALLAVVTCAIAWLAAAGAL